jgi:hypothetical protein
MAEIISPSEVSQIKDRDKGLSSLTSPPSEFVVSTGEYKVLNIHKVRNEERFEGKDMRDVAWEYIYRTNRLIEIIEGRYSNEKYGEIRSTDGEKYDGHKFDTVIYLDKSARPVSWLVRKFWQNLSNGENVQPTIHFLNINHKDKALEEAEVSGSSIAEDKIFDFRRLNKDKILAIRALFHQGELSESNWRSEVAKKSVFNGKNILIVDEVECSGKSLECAQRLLKLAFPEVTDISGVYFWDSCFSQEEYGRQMNSVPAWYKKRSTFGNEKSAFGRGIGDINEAYYKNTPHSLGIKLGSFVLSAPHIGEKFNRLKVSEDEEAFFLRKDINLLHQDFVRYKQSKTQ